MKQTGNCLASTDIASGTEYFRVAEPLPDADVSVLSDWRFDTNESSCRRRPALLQFSAATLVP